MATIDPKTPVLVGVGQCDDRWASDREGGHDPANAPSPMSLVTTASRAALADTGTPDRIAATIDCLIVVQTMHDYDRRTPQPFGRCANPPGTLAVRLGLAPDQLVYSVAGGDQPQALVNEAAEAIFGGRAQTVLLAGAEATAALKLALRNGVMLDWSDSVAGTFDDRGPGPALLSAYELANGLGLPIRTYPLFEHGLRARLGNSIAEHQNLMATLWAGFSTIAATHPHAQFPTARTKDFLKVPSATNYPVADPYLKWHVAQDAVNLSAAVIMTSVGQAQAIGIDPAKWIFLHGYAQAIDKTPLRRRDLGRSEAISLTLAHALAAALKTPAEIRHFDLYSCFPCVVLLAAEALGLDWRTTPATVTGGLPFFGGPGNNYSMHAIATMVEILRARPTDFGLVLANGGFLTKQAVGIYSAAPAYDWSPVSSAKIQKTIDDQPEPVLLEAVTTVVIASYCVTYHKGVARGGYIVGHNDDGRMQARVRDGDQATMLALLDGDPLGRTVRVVHDDGVNTVDCLD